MAGGQHQQSEMIGAGSWAGDTRRVDVNSLKSKGRWEAEFFPLEDLDFFS